MSRNLVKLSVIEPIETAHVQLMTDGSKTMAQRIVAMVKAGEDTEAVEKFISQQITSFIRPVKAKIKRALSHDEA